MPRDFSTDGALGGWGGNGGTADSAGGGAVGGYQANDWNSNQSGSASPSSSGAPSDSALTQGLQEMGPGGKPVAITDANQYGYWGGDYIGNAGHGYSSGATSGKNAFGFDIGSAITPEQAAQYHIHSNLHPDGSALGMHFNFADGGEVPNDGGSSGDLSDLLAMALSSVDQGLDYGRKKHGLMQQAAMSRTPMIPGNQSESGIPRPQPMPGPLPPTANPFGKRSQFGQNDNDADDQGTQTAQSGAIPDNDEDDTEAA